MDLQCQNLGKDCVRLRECGVAALVLCRSCPPHSEGLPPLCLHQPPPSRHTAPADGWSVDKLSSRGRWHVTVAFSDFSHHLPQPVWCEADAGSRQALTRSKRRSWNHVHGSVVMHAAKVFESEILRTSHAAMLLFWRAPRTRRTHLPAPRHTDPEHKHIPKLLWPLAQINPPTPPCSHHPCPQKLTLSLDHRHISCHSELCNSCTTSTRLVCSKIAK